MSKIDSEKKLDELYRWYKEVKFFVAILQQVLIWIIAISFAISVTLVIIVGFGKTADFVNGVWPQISVDAKFGAFISIVLLVLGSLIGVFIDRKYLKRRLK